MAHFQLSAQLVGHEKEVRAVLALSDQLLVTGSRDETLKVWSYSEERKEWQLENSFHLHNGFVSCLAALPSHCGSLVLSGGGDGIIRATDITRGSQVGKGEGHSNTVCDIQLGDEGNQFISSSWDCTSIVWKVEQTMDAAFSNHHQQNNNNNKKNDSECLVMTPLITLRGHQSAVWSAVMLSGHSYLTASADKTIKVWNDRGECLQTICAHRDVVRYLSKIPETQKLVSISNDGCAICYKSSTSDGESDQRHWEIEHRLFLSNHFLYCLTYLPFIDGFAAGGEDGSVVIFSFQQGTVIETISHPKTVWAVATLPHRQDLVTGCMDNICRIFTRDESRVADEATLQAFQASVGNKKLSSSMVQGVDWDKLPLYEQVIDTPGTREGELKVVKKGNEAQVLIWSQQKWSKFGDVVDNPNNETSSGQSGYLDGEYYDYIFDVDIGDDQPKRRLGYRRGENPLAAAQRFLLKEQLPLEYIDQVADFIDRNTDYRQYNKNMEGDPLTGSSRYIPMENNEKKNVSSDPFSENRYRPTSDDYTSTGNIPSSGKQQRHFPTSEFIYFAYSDQYANMRRKLSEFNHQVNEDMRLSNEEWNWLEKLIAQLEKANSISSCIFSENELKTMEKLLDWPTENIIPVLDIFRLMILSPSASSHFFLQKEKFGLDKLQKHILSSSKASIGVVIMACRAICNMFSSRLVALLACDQWESIIALFSFSVCISHPKSIEAYCALLHNYGIQLSKAEFLSTTSQWIKFALEWLQLLRDHKIEDFTSIYAVWTALGTVFVTYPRFLQEAMEQYSLLDIMEKYVPTSPKIKECIQQLENLIAAPLETQ